MNKIGWIVLLALLKLGLGISSPLHAQDVGEAQPTSDSPPADGQPVIGCCRIPADTVVDLEITQPINSAKQHRGDYFGLRLVSAVVVDGVVVLPAGTEGTGQIVEAQPSRGGGKPGELLLAARFLTSNGVQIPLHGMKFSATGADQTRVSMALGTAIGVWAMFIRGREIEVPSGTPVHAKVAGDVMLTPRSEVIPALLPVPSSSTFTALPTNQE
ncbi:MAG: hypothetical protein ABJA62_10155 [Luteimonas sp.]